MKFLGTLLILIAITSCQKADCELQEPQSGMICTMEYDPVCGCDGNTYSNACNASASGVPSYTNGECH